MLRLAPEATCLAARALAEVVVVLAGTGRGLLARQGHLGIGHIHVGGASLGIVVGAIGRGAQGIGARGGVVVAAACRMTASRVGGAIIGVCAKLDGGVGHDNLSRQ